MSDTATKLAPEKHSPSRENGESKERKVTYATAQPGDLVETETIGDDKIRYVVAVTAGDLDRGDFYMTASPSRAHVFFCATKNWENAEHPALAAQTVFVYRNESPAPLKKKTKAKAKA